MKIPNNFDGAKFADKYKLSAFDGDFWVEKGSNLICPSLPNLTGADIADCVIDAWIAIRIERDKLLAESDWTQLLDVVLTQDEKLEWSEYRQSLRDMPQDFENPEDVIFPEAPNE